MFTLPIDILLGFKCVYCRKLPTKPPIYQKENDELVCAECSNFIPINGKTWTRQKHLEVLLPNLKLHQKVSCSSTPLSSPSLSPETTPFEERFDNESKNFTYPTIGITPPQLSTNNSAHDIQNKDLKVEFSCSIKGNKTTKKATVLQYSMCIQKQNQKQLCLVDDSVIKRFYKDLKPVDVYVEGAIALTKHPKQVYGQMELVPLRYPIYESIASIRSSSLQPVNNNVLEEPKTMCGNGCLWRGSFSDLGEHLKICSMVTIHCWFEECAWKGSEQLLKGHLHNKHAAFIRDSITGTFATQDQFCIVIKAGIIFLFKYFYYDDYVEFLVQGVVNRNEMDYKFTVEVRRPDNGKDFIKFKSAKCLVYNKCTLQPGIKFSGNEFWKYQNSTFNVDISRIV